MNALKLFSTEQIREWDRYTIDHAPIRSLELMENAALACRDWLIQNFPEADSYSVLCGNGNNGGDGLAIARLLSDKKRRSKVFLLKADSAGSEDFESNLHRLKSYVQTEVIVIESVSDFPDFNKTDIVIDALYGSGLNRPVTGIASELIKALNLSSVLTIAIDIPSGLYADKSSIGNETVVKANYTLSFQVPKLAFMFPENDQFCGNWSILDIGLSDKYYSETATNTFLTDKHFIASILRKRNKFDHKGSNGHALLVAGSKGKMGAAVLASTAALRSGLGKLTVHSPYIGNDIMQISVPESLFSPDPEKDEISSIPLNSDYDSIGIGPGIGTGTKTENALRDLLKNSKTPLLMDADAINLLASDAGLLKQMPENAVLTPHIKEFERLAGKSDNDFERHERQIRFSKEYKVFIVLKGANTCISTPDGLSFFNSSGNPGMAKAGSGDVLSGLLTGLLAQQYNSLHSALIAVFVHGLAGDLAAAEKGEAGIKAGDIAEYIPYAFKSLESI